MAKKIRKRNVHYYNDGGFFTAKNFKDGKLNDFMGAVGNLAGGAISGGFSTGAGKTMQGLSSAASLIPGPWGAVAGVGLNLVGGLANRAFGSQINQQAVDGIKTANTNQSNIQFNASNNDDLLSQGNFGFLGNIDRSTVGKDGWFSNKAKNFTAQLNTQRQEANAQALGNYATAVSGLNNRNDLMANANFAALGGPINMLYSGSISPFGNRFDIGGDLQLGEGNRVTTINEGGTHEENPYEGVPMGVDAQGTPNLVEEGEVIFNDYVFSDRLRVPKATRQKYKLRESSGLTFAEAAKKISKEAEERPNDPISKNGLEAMLGELALVQETERQLKLQKDMPKANIKAEGGLLGRLYSGTGPYSNFLSSPDQENPYAFYGNNGRNSVTNQRIAGGWSNFTDNNGNVLFDVTKGEYSPSYTDARFQSWLKDNYNNLSGGWWNTTNAPDYFKAGNKTAPTVDQMFGSMWTPGLMYDKKYGEAHDFGRHAYNQYLESQKPKPTPPVNPAQVNTPITPVVETPQIETPDLEQEDLELPRYETRMRYAPILGAGLGIVTDALGWTNKPDYANADAILEATANGGKYIPVAPRPIGDYLTYNPFDRDYHINKLNSQSTATGRALVNQSAGNRATAIASLLANDYNAQSKLGDLARQAEEYNLAQKERVATFNRGTNQFNSEQAFKADLANQSALAQLRDYNLKGTMAAAELKERINAQSNAARSANLTNLLQGLGDMGKENVAFNQMNWAIENGVFGPMQNTTGRDYRKKKSKDKLLTKKKGK